MGSIQPARWNFWSVIVVDCQFFIIQMGYFRDITTGQSLEDVDISVHCDVTIFEWLMKWIKNRDNLKSNSSDGCSLDLGCDNNLADGASSKKKSLQPCLEPGNVVSILVSASFLKMEPLVDIGLKYVHGNMNRILLATHNLNCLGEPLLTRQVDNFEIPPKENFSFPAKQGTVLARSLDIFHVLSLNLLRYDLKSPTNNWCPLFQQAGLSLQTV